MDILRQLRATTRILAVALIGIAFRVSSANATPEPPAKLMPPSKPFVPKKPFLTTSYEVVLLGPFYYDGTKPETFHAYYYEPDYPRDKHHDRIFERNARMWKERMPSLLQAAGKSANLKTKMVIQLGNLMQGECGSPSLSRKMIKEALETYKKAFPKTPCLTTPDRHDRRGHGAAAAYDAAVFPFISKELRRTVKKATFCQMQGPDLFLFIDSAQPDIEEIEKTFREHQTARYKFVVCAAPLIPIDDWSAPNLLFGRKPDPRRRMRELFLKNDVIVLSHGEGLIGLSEVITDSGRITQLLVDSVFTHKNAAIPRAEASGARDYGKFQPNKDEMRKKKKQDWRPILYEYKNALTRYERYRFAGFGVLKISGEGVVAEIHGGDSAKVAKTFKLR